MCINFFLFRFVFKKNLKQLLWKESSLVLFNMAAQPRGAAGRLTRRSTKLPGSACETHTSLQIPVRNISLVISLLIMC